MMGGWEGGWQGGASCSMDDEIIGAFEGTESLAVESISACPSNAC